MTDYTDAYIRQLEARLDALEARLICLEQDRALTATLHYADRDPAIVAAVASACRDAGSAATTSAVATRIGYSVHHARRLLKAAALRGKVRAVAPLTGKRSSGLWLLP